MVFDGKEVGNPIAQILILKSH